MFITIQLDYIHIYKLIFIYFLVQKYNLFCQFMPTFVFDLEIQETIGTTFSLSSLPLLPGLTTKQNSVKCVLHIKLCLLGNQSFLPVVHTHFCRSSGL